MAVALLHSTTANVTTNGLAYDVTAHTCDAATETLLVVMTGRSNTNGPNVFAISWDSFGLTEELNYWTLIQDEIGVWVGRIHNPSKGNKTLHIFASGAVQFRGLRVDFYDLTGVVQTGSIIGASARQNHGASASTKTVTLSINCVGDGHAMAFTSLALIDASSGLSSFTGTGFVDQATGVYGNSNRVNITGRYKTDAAGTITTSATFLTGDLGIGGALFEVLSGAIQVDGTAQTTLALPIGSSAQIAAQRPHASTAALAVASSAAIPIGGDPQNPPGVWTGAALVYDPLSAKEIKTARSVPSSGITRAKIRDRPAGTFADTSYLRETAPTASALLNFSHEVFVEPSGIPGEGRMLRIGGTTVQNDTRFDIRIQATSSAAAGPNVYGMTRRDAAGTAQFTTTPKDTAALVPQHVVAALPAGQVDQIYVNGLATDVFQTGTVVSGALPVLTTDELAIGSPTVSGRPSLIGKMSRTVVWPFVMQPSHVAVTYRHQAVPMEWLGIGGENRISDLAHAPVAVPVHASAVRGGTATIDVVSAAFDEDGGTLAIVGTPTCDVGSVVVSAGKIFYTAPASGSTAATITFDIGDGSGKVSRGYVFVEIRAPGTNELPVPKRTLSIVSTAELADVISPIGSTFLDSIEISGTDRFKPLRAGDHVLFGDGLYTGNYTIAQSGTSADPIVFRSINPQQASLTGTLNVTGKFKWFYQLTFANTDTVAHTYSFELQGDDNKIFRNIFNSVSCIRITSAPGSGNGASRNRIWYNSFINTGFDDARQLDLVNDVQLEHHSGDVASGLTPQDNWFLRNYHKGRETPGLTNPSGSARLGINECMYIGTTKNNGVFDANIQTRTVIEYNYFDRCDRENCIRIKSHGNIVRFNTVVGPSINYPGKKGNQFESRSGTSNQFVSNIIDSSANLSIFDYDNPARSPRLGPNIAAGNLLKGAARLLCNCGWTAQEHSPANASRYVGNDTTAGVFILANRDGSTVIPLQSAVVEAHTPSFTTADNAFFDDSGLPPAGRSVISISPTATIVVPPRVTLTPADVGHLANFGSA